MGTWQERRCVSFINEHYIYIQPGGGSGSSSSSSCVTFTEKQRQHSDRLLQVTLRVMIITIHNNSSIWCRCQVYWAESRTPSFTFYTHSSWTSSEAEQMFWSNRDLSCTEGGEKQQKKQKKKNLKRWNKSRESPSDSPHASNINLYWARVPHIFVYYSPSLF